MSRHEIGIDLVDIERIVAVLERFPDRFRHRVLTEREQEGYVGRRPYRIAGRWAAKEAISKVLGLGVRGVGWREIEAPELRRAPQVTLHGRAARRAEALDLDEVTARSRTSATWRWRWWSPIAVTPEPWRRRPLDHAALGRAEPGRLRPRGRKGRVRLLRARHRRLDRVSGAALLAGLGAMRAGAGLVRVATADSVVARLSA